MKKVISLSMVLIWAFPAILRGEPVSLVRDGQATSVIYVAKDDISEPELNAARELQHYLRQISGAFIPICYRGYQPGKTKIEIGQTSRTRKILPEVDWNGLGPDGIVIKTRGDTLVLAGGRPRGTLYAVYAFLQDQLGCRWYAADCEVVPQKGSISVDMLDIVYRPTFEYREIYTEEFTDPWLAVKLMQNGRQFYNPIPCGWGDGLSFGSAHTLTTLFLKPEKYFAGHPDWYAWRTDKKHRVRDQLCLTSVPAREECVREVEAYLRANPKLRMISISAADNDQLCECADCVKLQKKLGNRQSGRILDFANFIANGIYRNHPEVLVNVLAYWHTVVPPENIKPAKNVMIMLAPMRSNYALSLAEVPSWVETVQKWRKLSSAKVYIWDYMTNFHRYFSPFPDYFTMADNLRLYRKNGIEGVFIQGAMTPAGEFEQLKAYVYARMMWNPELNERTLTTEFLDGYYGPAGPFLMQYMDLMTRDIRSRKQTGIHCFDNDTNRWLTFKTVTEGTRLFNQAQAAVKDDPTFLYRVRRSRLGLDIVWLERYQEFFNQSHRDKVEFLGPKDPWAEYNRIARDEFQVGIYREWAKFPEFLKVLKEKLPVKQ